MSRTYYVYIMTNRHNNVLYMGVTSNIKRRVYEHKSHEIDGFTKKYKVSKLVCMETYQDVLDAIAREEKLKGGSRKTKLRLIDSYNKDWIDLANCI
jgi:putative endonuclease